MKRFAKYLTFSFTSIILLLMPLVVSFASEPSPYLLYYGGAATDMSFSGSVGTCSLYIAFESGTSNVQGTWAVKDTTTGSQIASWYVNKNSTVDALRTVDVTRGHTYKVSFSGTAYGKNGGSEPITCSTTRTYN